MKNINSFYIINNLSFTENEKKKYDLQFNNNPEQDHQ